MCGPKGEEKIEEPGTLVHEKHSNLNSSTNKLLLRLSRSRKKRCVGHVETLSMGEMRNAFNRRILRKQTQMYREVV
jgi:hypothetical protein